MNNKIPIKDQEDTQIRVNAIRYYAMEYSDKGIDPAELKTVDCTDLLLEELPKMLKNRERINININGQTTSGKSTLGIWLLKYIHYWGAKLGQFNTQLTIRNIARDQQEGSKIFQNPDIKDTAILVDEWSALEDSGENSSVAMKMWTQFSDVMAQRFIHIICCSPKGIGDPNSDIFLEVQQADKTKGITHCHLYYNLFKGGQEIPILLGYVNINVKEIVQEWAKVLPIFYKKNKTEEDKKFLINMRKKDFYIEYMYKKYEKMDMLTKEGIGRAKGLDYPEIVLKIIQDFKELMDMGNIINADVIRNAVRVDCRQAKVIQSVVGEGLMTSEIMGTLKLWQGFYKLNQAETKMKKMFKDGKIDHTQYVTKTKILEEKRNQLAKRISVQEDEYRKLIEIKEKYNTFVSC